MPHPFDDRFGEAAWPAQDWPVAERPRTPLSADRIRDAIVIVLLLGLLGVLCTMAWSLAHTGRWG